MSLDSQGGAGAGEASPTASPSGVSHDDTNTIKLSATRVGSSKFAGYERLLELGSGGMAQVFLAVDRGPFTDFSKLVVLKFLQPAMHRDPDLVRMFMNEARIAARLSHPNVVHTYAVGTDHDRHAIVMEYVEGVDLSALLKQLRDVPFEERRPLLGVVAQVLTGLQYVHEFRNYDGSAMGLMHRDVKPGNVMVGYDGQVKVLDFGIAKQVVDDDRTGTGSFKGTLRYAAPELANSSGSLGPAVDVFSAGALLWEVIVGRSLWDGIGNLEIVRRLARGELPLEALSSAPVSDALGSLCRRALAMDPAERPPSAEAFRLALEATPEFEPTVCGPASLGRLVSSTFAAQRAERAVYIQRALEGEFVDPDHGEQPTLAESQSERVATSPTLDQRARSFAGVLIAATIGSVVASVVLLGMREEPPVPVEAPVAQPSAPPIVEAVAPPAEPEPPAPIVVEATPRDAVFHLDGRPLPGNPIDVPRPGPGVLSELRVEAAGHAPQSLSLSNASRSAVHVVLVPTPPEPEPPTRRRPRGKRPGPTAPSTPSGPAIDRDNPYAE